MCVKKMHELEFNRGRAYVQKMHIWGLTEAERKMFHFGTC